MIIANVYLNLKIFSQEGPLLKVYHVYALHHILTQFFMYSDGINKLVHQTIMLNAERFKLRLVKLYTGNAD